MRIFAALAVIATLLLSLDPAFAQATRTWVSGVGDDANPCSRTAPCKTFAGAISKTASGGEIDALDPGGYGAVTITKSITIDGGPGIAGVLVSGTNGIVISAGATDVVNLRNLDIDGINTGLDGIKLLSGASLVVDHCKIYSFVQNGIEFAPNGAAQMVVVDSVITNNVGSGLRIDPSAGTSRVVIARTTSTGNGGGMRGEGTAGGTSNISLTESQMSNNSGNGLAAVSGPGSVFVELLRSDVSHNSVNGVQANAAGGGSALVVVGASMLVGNAGLAANGVSGGQVQTNGNNQVSLNGTNGTFSGPAALQ